MTRVPQPWGLNRMRFVMIFAASLTLASTAHASQVYTFLPGQGSEGSSMAVADGLQFQPIGSDFVLTNASILNGSSLLQYLNFGVAYDYTDASGNIFYRPDNSQYQLYVLGNTLGSISPQSVQEAVFSGLAELVSLGGGQYEFSGNLLEFATPGVAGLDGTGHVAFTFNTNARPGYQITGGTLTFTPNVVPLPASAVLFALGGLMTAAGRRLVSKSAA
jgi:hypothetical protein